MSQHFQEGQAVTETSPITYASAGVDVEAGDRAVELTARQRSNDGGKTWEAPGGGVPQALPGTRDTVPRDGEHGFQERSPPRSGAAPPASQCWSYPGCDGRKARSRRGRRARIRRRLLDDSCDRPHPPGGVTGVSGLLTGGCGRAHGGNHATLAGAAAGIPCDSASAADSVGQTRAGVNSRMHSITGQILR